jgi:hypothetical protein
MRGSLRVGLSLALLLRSSLAFAEDTSPQERPRTTDEVVQLYATSVAYGASIGAAWIWHYRATLPEEGGWSPALRSGVLWGGATAGAVIGIVRYELSPSTPGQAAFTGSVALWTGVLASLVAGALTRDESRRDDRASLGAAVGLEVGLVIGGVLGRVLELEPSIGWVRTLDAGALLGGALAGGAYLLAGGGELHDQGTLALASAGVATGLATAVLLAPYLGFSSGMAFSIAPDFAVGGEGVGLRFQSVL